MKIGTHSGQFHADEALAVWMLKKVPKFSSAEVVRTRDPAVLETCDIVCDVGGKYEPPKWFDHHQREFTTTFDVEHTITKLSSAGLIYKHYGKEVLNEILGAAVERMSASDPKKRKLDVSKMVESIYLRLYDSFIEAIDGMDNGVNASDAKPAYNTRGMMLQSVVGNLSPNPGEAYSDEILNRQFEKASELMGLAFEGEVRSMGLGWYVSRRIVMQAYESRHQYDQKGRIMVLEDVANWKDVLREIEDEQGNANEGKVLYVLYPTSDSVRIQAVAVAEGSFESRKALPQPWRGVRDEELDRVSGVAHGVFVHVSGFIGGNKTREGAIKMAQKAADW